jgi:hypothetical protein
MEDSSKECSLFTLDWVCPGRKEIKTTETSGDAGGEEQKYKCVPFLSISIWLNLFDLFYLFRTEEKSDFDFWDEPKESNKTAVVPRRIGPGVYSNKQPRGSAKKKTTSLDGIMASIRRHRKLDQQPDKSSSQEIGRAHV